MACVQPPPPAAVLGAPSNPTFLPGLLSIRCARIACARRARSAITMPHRPQSLGLLRFTVFAAPSYTAWACCFTRLPITERNAGTAGFLFGPAPLSGGRPDTLTAAPPSSLWYGLAGTSVTAIYNRSFSKPVTHDGQLIYSSCTISAVGAAPIVCCVQLGLVPLVERLAGMVDHHGQRMARPGGQSKNPWASCGLWDLTRFTAPAAWMGRVQARGCTRACHITSSNLHLW